MSFLIKKLFLGVIFNSCLFVILFIGIQNSSDKNKVDFLIDAGLSLSAASKYLAKKNGLKKSEVYNLI